MHLHHDHIGAHEHHHHDHDCSGSCQGCASQCEHTPMEELTALAAQLEKMGNHTAYEQVMAAVSDFEKGNMRLSVVLSSLK